MRTNPRTRTLGVLTAAVLALSACGTPGSGGGQAESDPTSAAGGAPACEPVAGETLVVLEDDLGLQNADNVIPAINAQVAADHPQVVELLDAVSAALDTDRLIELNRAVDVERRTPTEVAAQFVTDESLESPDASVGSGTSLTVGAANFSESITLAEIYAQVLRSAGFDAQAQTIGARETYLPALQSGEIAVVPEYAATLVTYLNAEVNGADAPSVASSDVEETVTALEPLAEDSGLVVGAASAAQDQNAFAVTAEFAAEHELTTLSDLAATCGEVVLAGPPECPERPFCQIGLEETYGLSVGEFKSYDFALIGQAVRQGDAAVGLVTSSDGSLATRD
ncbi:glycine betaine ABC transporter substrate-binding protein [Cellulomonas dongxiuzhuiae]|uniref:glycine betaine ABC transporter substrate-binding protein n=1 Tax=Cellulomonas dongxiuzhuiae TaxID=2819979 RepID=UPI001AAE513F|nr:glycine betaine ABC transporter substrate-binding protein [Cellulomonas dongxiuzhuiae]MBO3087692.1 glycine/betaine ABC transporter substrate-binding protein [Cellulomonas dongxiuzhuiae]